MGSVRKKISGMTFWRIAMNDSKNQNYLLDANIISEIIKLNPDFNVLKKFVEHSSDCAITVMTWHELLYGVERLADGLRKTELSKFLNDDVDENFPLINYSKKAAEIHAKIRAACENNGDSVPYGDSQIAAIAIAEDMILVTRNIKHFHKIAEYFPLRLENWFLDS